MLSRALKFAPHSRCRVGPRRFAVQKENISTTRKSAVVCGGRERIPPLTTHSTGKGYAAHRVARALSSTCTVSLARLNIHNNEMSERAQTASRDNTLWARPMMCNEATVYAARGTALLAALANLLCVCVALALCWVR
jgi:hypothetical protein